MVNVRKTPKGTLEQRPLWTPLALLLGARAFFMWEYINLADSPGWVKKVTAGCGGFFSVVGSWGIVGWIYGVLGMGRFMRRAGNENEKNGCRVLGGIWAAVFGIS